jgi:hypothetical protein
VGSVEPGSEDEFYKKRLAGPLATDNKPPYEQNRAEKCERTPTKPEGPAWRRALVPSLGIAGTGALLCAV